MADKQIRYPEFLFFAIPLGIALLVIGLAYLVARVRG